jgi:hypothetical protein
MAGKNKGQLKKSVPLQIVAASPIHSNHPSRDNGIVAPDLGKSKKIPPDNRRKVFGLSKFSTHQQWSH